MVRADVLANIGANFVRQVSNGRSAPNFNGEFDSGSERTLAAWIRHASRTGLSLVAIPEKV